MDRLFAVQSSGTGEADDAEIAKIGEQGRDIATRGVEGPRRSYVNYATGNEGVEAMYHGAEPWRKLMLETAKNRWDPRRAFSKYNPVHG